MTHRANEVDSQSSRRRSRLDFSPEFRFRTRIVSALIRTQYLRLLRNQTRKSEVYDRTNLRKKKKNPIISACNDGERKITRRRDAATCKHSRHRCIKFVASMPGIFVRSKNQPDRGFML